MVSRDIGPGRWKCEDGGTLLRKCLRFHTLSFVDSYLTSLSESLLLAVSSTRNLCALLGFATSMYLTQIRYESLRHENISG